VALPFEKVTTEKAAADIEKAVELNPNMADQYYFRLRKNSTEQQ